MSEGGNSYRQILRSTSLIGGAAVLNTLLGLLRIKAAAVLLGPAGVGLIGLLSSLVGTASAVAGMGFGNVGTRQIAAATSSGDQAAIAATRRSLAWGTLILACAGSAGFWALRDVIAYRLLGDAALSTGLGWLSVAVGLTVMSSSQTALLNGMRRVTDMAWVSVISAVLSLFSGVAVLLAWGQGALIAFVLVVPASTFLIGCLYVARVPKLQVTRTPALQIWRQWETLFKLGGAFMLAGLAGMLGQFAVRLIIQKQLGSEALGFFQAAATISITYIGFVLAAMGSDYYPRLTATIHDHGATNKLVNEQTEVALLLAGPMFMVMLALAPWLIDLLYAQSFRPAAQILQWQVIGDILKVCSWPLGFVLLASGNGRMFMLSECLAVVVLLLTTLLLLQPMGLVGSAIAFIAMYAVYLPLVHWLAVRRTAFKWSLAVRFQTSALLACAVCVLILSSVTVIGGALIGGLMAVGFGVQSASRLARHAGFSGVTKTVSAYSQKLLSRLRG